MGTMPFQQLYYASVYVAKATLCGGVPLRTLRNECPEEGISRRGATFLGVRGCRGSTSSSREIKSVDHSHLIGL